MAKDTYRIESNQPMIGPLLPPLGSKFIHVGDRDLAIVLATKSTTRPCGHEIRLVYVPTGAIVFRKTAASLASGRDDDWSNRHAA